jgi:hypothetical protein
VDVNPIELTPVESDDVGWHQYTALVDGRPVHVEISARWARTPVDARALADKVVPRIVSDRPELTAYCAEALLADHNREWSDGREQLDEATFRSMLSLIGIGVMPDGHVRARFADAGLFRGHDVVVDLDPDLRYVYTMLE